MTPWSGNAELLRARRAAAVVVEPLLEDEDSDLPLEHAPVASAMASATTQPRSGRRSTAAS
jgi:hypothetical protein